MQPTRLIFALAMVAALVACGSSRVNPASEQNYPSTHPLAALTPQAKWAAAHITHYRFDYRTECFSAPIFERIEVRDGRVVAHHPLGTDARATVGVEIPTIDTLLQQAAEADRKATGEVEITYDPATGVPTDASIDWIKNAMDDEMSWTVKNFAPLAA